MSQRKHKQKQWHPLAIGKSLRHACDIASDLGAPIMEERKSSWTEVERERQKLNATYFKNSAVALVAGATITFPIVIGLNPNLQIWPTATISFGMFAVPLAVRAIAARLIMELDQPSRRPVQKGPTN